MIRFSKSIIFAVFFISIFSFPSTAHAQTNSSSITDSSNDVMLVRTTQGSNGKLNTYIETVASQPNIDILSASYTANDNGSVSISLTVKGHIETDNLTYYSIQLIGLYLTSTVSRQFIIQIYYTTLFSIDSGAIIPNVQYSYLNGSVNGYGLMHSYASGSTLTTTLEPNITSATNNNFTVTLPKSFPENEINNNFNTTWHIITHYGNSTIYQDQFGGDQYYDYYPNAENYFLNISHTQIPPVPGFEFIPAIIALPVIIGIKKKLRP